MKATLVCTAGIAMTDPATDNYHSPGGLRQTAGRDTMMRDRSGDETAEPERDMARSSESRRSCLGGHSRSRPSFSDPAVVQRGPDHGTRGIGFLRCVVDRLPGSELIVAEDGSTDGAPRFFAAYALDPRLRPSSCRPPQGLCPFLDGRSLPREQSLHFYSDRLQFCPADSGRCTSGEGFDLVTGRRVGRNDQCYASLDLRLQRLAATGLQGRHPGCGQRFQALQSPRRRRVFPRLGFKDLVGSELVLRTIRAGLLMARWPWTINRDGTNRGDCRSEESPGRWPQR